MKKINYIIFPYRSYFFKKKYGVAVRDLQIIEIIKSIPSTENVLIVDRPLSMYEAILGRGHSEAGYLKHISWDLIGPLKRRSWTATCYSELYGKIDSLVRDWKNVVILDFTPMAKISLSEIRHDFYWYDLIDNFTKHNRFTEEQKNLVKEKYEFVANQARLITGVTDEALSLFKINKLTLPNGVCPHEPTNAKTESSYKYGFMGFITDKLDLSFISTLSESDPEFSLVVYGDIFDSVVKKKLLAISGVTLGGRFSRNNVPTLMNSFKVGLIPYLESKSHDGSPLKLYEYMLFGKPVVTSIDYEVTGEFIINYNSKGINSSVLELNRLLSIPYYEDKVRSLIRAEDHMDFKVSNVITRIIKTINHD